MLTRVPTTIPDNFCLTVAIQKTKLVHAGNLGSDSLYYVLCST